jgi:predicted DCC family thiol-disulfide oxidoreductase YuxK
MEKYPKTKKIILFDGVCNLCNSAVLFIIKQDSKDLFRFVALQSELEKRPYWDRLAKMDSIILYEPGTAYYYKSEAALKIAAKLDSFYSMLWCLKFYQLHSATLYTIGLLETDTDGLGEKTTA